MPLGEAFERDLTLNYPNFSARVGILTDVWIECGDLRPIAAVLLIEFLYQCLL